MFAVRFRAYGKREYVTLGTAEEGWTQAKAEEELGNVLADVRRGIWRSTVGVEVGEPEEVPTFHIFASEWFDRHKHEVKERTVEFWRGHLSGHLLPFFAEYPLDAITPERVDQYKVSKLQERERWDAATPEERNKRLVPQGFGATSINKSLALLARILDEAIEYGHIPSNPAKGRRRRLRPSKPHRTWLEPHEAQAVLDAGGQKHRPLIATMMLAGLRVGELIALRWRDVDLAAGTLRIPESKTDAGVRVLDVSPMLREELVVHRADSDFTEPDDLVFCTSKGTPHLRGNIRVRIVGKAVERANAALVEAGMQPIADGITNHSLRRTFASLLYEAGASPAYVMAQMGHTSSALALEVYARKMARSRDTGARMDALIRGADWARMGTNPENGQGAFSEKKTKVPV